MPKTSNKPVLEMKNISKSFPGVKALDDVSIDLFPGEIHALLGENGAGKSTLIKILGGVYATDEGRILIDGNEVKVSDPVHATKQGIAIIHQEIHLIPALSVADNVMLGQHPIHITGIIKSKDLQKQAKEMLNILGLDIPSNTLVNKLTPAAQQLILIGQALSRNPRFLVMDEPTSALGDADIKYLFEVIRKLVKQGVAIIYISHKLDEIFELSDRVTVLRDGKYVGTKKTSGTNHDELISLMVGRKLTEMYPKKKTKIGKVIFEVVDFIAEGIDVPVNFEVHAGEILGVFGLLGSGRTRLFSSIFGALEGKGTILMNGKPIKVNSPSDALSAGLGMLPIERKKEGLVQIMNVSDNLLLSNYKAYIKYGFMQDRTMRSNSEKWIEAMRIQCTGRNQIVNTLSGGNQQKVVFGRLMEVNSNVLILNSPTRGIDVGAKVEIYNLMGQLCSQGKAIIFITSELPELLGLSDRVLVITDNRITGKFLRKNVTQEMIMRAAVGEDLIACKA